MLADPAVSCRNSTWGQFPGNVRVAENLRGCEALEDRALSRGSGSAGTFGAMPLRFESRMAHRLSALRGASQEPCILGGLKRVRMRPERRLARTTSGGAPRLAGRTATGDAAGQPWCRGRRCPYRPSGYVSGDGGSSGDAMCLTFLIVRRPWRDGWRRKALKRASGPKYGGLLGCLPGRVRHARNEGGAFAAHRRARSAAHQMMRATPRPPSRPAHHSRGME
jgi:hypothetical protein